MWPHFTSVIHARSICIDLWEVRCCLHMASCFLQKFLLELLSDLVPKPMEYLEVVMNEAMCQDGSRRMTPSSTYRPRARRWLNAKQATNKSHHQRGGLLLHVLFLHIEGITCLNYSWSKTKRSTCCLERPTHQRRRLWRP